MDVIILIGLLLVIKVMLLLLIHSTSRLEELLKVQSFFSISVRNFDEAYIGIPSKEEQTQIAKLLITIDKRIATQNKIIEDLKKLKSAITDLLFHSIADAHTIRLGAKLHILRMVLVTCKMLIQNIKKIGILSLTVQKN